jgi:hypothetical protein
VSFIAIDYYCVTCGGTMDDLQPRGNVAPSIACLCGGKARKCLSAPMVKQKLGHVVTGASAERPPWALDTRPLADGRMTTGEWRKQNSRRKVA